MDLAGVIRTPVKNAPSSQKNKYNSNASWSLLLEAIIRTSEIKFSSFSNQKLSENGYHADVHWLMMVYAIKHTRTRAVAKFTILINSVYGKINEKTNSN